MDDRSQPAVVITARQYLANQLFGMRREQRLLPAGVPSSRRLSRSPARAHTAYNFLNTIFITRYAS